jgi:hypothetical protein
MQSDLPELIYDKLAPTCDYLREVALTLGSLQRAFLPKDPRDWQHGLEVNLRGLVTQRFMVNGTPTQASLDMLRQKVRLSGQAWALGEYTPPEIFNTIQAWLETQAVKVDLIRPKFSADSSRYSRHQADLYMTALWWMDQQFRWLKNNTNEGLTSPVLLYPHHFDLSLVWFPHSDDRQLAVGFSPGDDVIAEPYVYITAYPEPAGFKKLALPKEAYYQSSGFHGVILPYAQLSVSPEPVKLLRDFALNCLTTARSLLG